MKFYFCEGCGVRITDADLGDGLGKNKKLKGVYCKQCAVGVTTMESLPLSDATAKELVANESQRGDVRKTAGKRPRSRSSGRANVGAVAKRQSSSLGSSRTMSVPARARSGPTANLTLWIGLGVGLALIGGVVLVASMSGKEQTRKKVARKKRSARPKPDVKERTADNVDPGSKEDASEAPDRTVTPPESKDSQAANSAPSTVADKKPVVTEPPPATQSDEKRQSTPAEDTKTKETDQQKAAAVEPPKTPDKESELSKNAALAVERLATRTFLERLLSALKDGDMANAVEICKAGKLPIAGDARQVLEQASKLHRKALDELNRNPPSDKLNIKWKKQEISGQLVRIKGDRAWIKSGPMELSVGMASLPPDLLLRALKLDPKDPKCMADQAVFSFAGGDVKASEAALAKQEPDIAPGLRRILAEVDALKKRDDFEGTIVVVMAAIKEGQRNTALSLIEELKKAFPESCSGEHKARIDKLVEDAKNTSLLRALVEKAVRAEVLKVDDDGYVELRYDFEKHPECAGDLTSKSLKADPSGILVPSRPNPWIVGKATSVRLEALFQPKSLRAELTLKGGTDVYVFRIGNLFNKLRWPCRTVDFQFNSRYKVRNLDAGTNWKPPPARKWNRYILERGPEHAVIRLGDTVVKKVDMATLVNVRPHLLQSETNWIVGLSSYRECILREIVIKGHLDLNWLKSKGVEK